MFTRKTLYALLLLPMLALAPGARAAPTYTVTYLPTGTSANGINNVGQIAGTYWSPTGQHAYIWADGALTDLGTTGAPGAAGQSYGLAINDAGQVTGRSYAGLGVDGHAFLYPGTAMQDLGTLPGGAASTGRGINAAGQVVGDAWDAAGNHAVLFSQGQATRIDVTGAGYSSAQDINDAGQIIGQFADVRGFLYANGAMVDIGTLGGTATLPRDINEAGQVVGFSGTADSSHAFLYSDGRMTDLGALGGGSSDAWGINNGGQVVGSIRPGAGLDTTAFLYSDGKMVDLNSLVELAPGWSLVGARGINDLQQIAADACYRGSCVGVRLDLASSVPEPGTYAMLLAGLVVLSLLGEPSAAWRRARFRLRRRAR